MKSQHAAWVGLVLSVLFPPIQAQAQAQLPKLNVAYASSTTNFSIARLAKIENIFRKHNLDVELILMQGPSTYLPALLSNNIQVPYGGGTAVSRTIAAADAPIVVIGTETRYVPQRLMVAPAIKTIADLKGKKIGVSRAGLDEYSTPAVVKNRDARPYLDPSFVQRAVDKLGVGKK